MIFRNLYYNIIFRIVLLVASCFLLPIAHNKYNDIVIDANIVVLIIIQIILLIRRLNYVNRDLISFFDSIKYDESSILLSNKEQSQDYFRLSKRLQRVNQQIIKLKEKNVQQDFYYKTIIEHATVGLLVFDSTGKIKLCNKAFKALLHIENPTHISDLNMLHGDFEDTLQSINIQEQSLIKVKVHNNLTQLVIRATELKTKEEKLKLVSVQDINHELDKKELDAWQKMVRILRHEIMNSISPISSTIDTLNDIITNPENNKTHELESLSQEIIEDIAAGLKIVQERNKGIQKFIDQFRTISKLPEPTFEKTDISSLLDHVQAFWKKDLEGKGIELKTYSRSDNSMVIDKNQIEQILINLIKNSVEADATKIILSHEKTVEGKHQILIMDNGKGISDEILDNIFVPFFTTKEQGSGIGLSLARQIMRLHGGNITVQATTDKTTFILEF
ncbi:MAG: ATP-binding protein [Bacteroidetes bacterium]|nr:ATP-binding protein [Bacteroidota bacterium]